MTDQPPTPPEPTQPPAPAPTPGPAVPTLGRVVFYSDRQIPGSCRLAHVAGTRTSIAHDEGIPLPTSDLHVHLKIMPPAGAIYDAHDVGYDPDGAPGTWRWPTRVAG